ncbi:hypothetical protein [Paraburkholderia xenovorans]|nr:hypothetical protein [Paraburkholderia xenovorans]
MLDNSNVEHLWPNHRHINWETGEPDEPEGYAGPGKHTHCSAFAAAIGERLNVYMLRPPEHSQILLASAQTHWFNSPEGRGAGWFAIADLRQAQSLANQGKLVVVAYESPNLKTPGHIAIVRPSAISSDALRDRGPEVTQAGAENYLRIDARTAFAYHPGAWPEGVRYFGHDVPRR